MIERIEIPLTQKKVAFVSPEDYERVRSNSWCAADVGGGRFYAMAKHGGKTVYMHRVIGGAGQGQMVDHINGNTLDNTRGNLRVCTHAENLANRTSAVRGASGYLGVHSADTRRGEQRWAASIMKNRKRVHLGSFMCPVEAAIARDVAAIELHGGFASLNFPHLAEVFHPCQHQQD